MSDKDNTPWTRIYRVRFGLGKAPILLRADNLADALTKAKTMLEKEAGTPVKGVYFTPPEIKGVQLVLEGALLLE
jgi:hypothetical protein